MSAHRKWMCAARFAATFTNALPRLKPYGRRLESVEFCNEILTTRPKPQLQTRAPSIAPSKRRYMLRCRMLAVVCAVLIARVGVAGASQQGAPVVAAVGDIACDPSDPHFNGGKGTLFHCAELRTAQRLAKDSTVDLVLGLGDYQYYCDSLGDYPLSYTPSWGVFNSMIYPVAGNHEYITGKNPIDGDNCPSTNTTAANYFYYFGVNADPDGNGGYFSFDRGSWHIIGLNANCGSIGGCGSKSAESKWLSNDLNTTTQPCILAYWHQPRWTGESSNNLHTSAWWTLLYNKGADLVLNGHIHNYQRFAKLDPSGQPSNKGVREVIVGTGGGSLAGFSSTANPQPQVKFKQFGYLRLVLMSNSYSASFIRSDGVTLDSFSGACNK